MKRSALNLFILLVASAFHLPYKVEADKAFMIKATQSNLAEITAAKLALAQSQSDSVKAFAQMMIDDHTNAQTELAALAKSENVTLPDSTDDQHRMFAQRLMMVSGKTFDSAYMQSQVQDHVKAIALFTAEIQNGLDAQAKAYASKLLPKLQMHLQHAQNVAGNMGGMNMQQ
ncbi:MAG: DUF4142 domain-containing protein [Parafilimonas sp.]|nr:DUF4142 domain-containing protein [Parafilimonas sp.]